MEKSLENVCDYVYDLFREGKTSQKFVKKSLVMARPAVVGEEIVTLIKDKETKQLREETRQIATAENPLMIVTNPGGEVYAPTVEEFEERYVATEKEGEYLAKATPRNLIQIDEEITFEAPWGGDMTIQAGGWLNVDGLAKGDVYGINPEEFNETHIPYNEKTMGKNRE